MEYNDYELVYLAQENNEYATKILHEKYKIFIYNKAKKVFNILKGKGLELDDILQEANIGFDKAIMGYNQDDKALFYTFVNVCIDRQLKTFILKQCRDKHKILNDAVTLDADEDMDFYNFISDNITPESELFNLENTSKLYNDIKELLNDLEEIVFDLKIQGFSYKEISDILDIEIKDIYNSVERIKIKINKVLNK